ncbi:MAG: hypothetical protein Q8R24_05385 [Legionellaceae bacterium]|nr:hypothetical protein [Legionellaceae bacterium]
MSLINETLNNLKHNSNKESVLLNPSSSRSSFESDHKARSLQNLLIILMSTGIIVTLFFIAYHFQFSKYYHASQEFISNKSAWLTSSANSVKQKIAFNKTSITIAKPANIPVSLAQIQYYDAMNLLNEGKDDQARQDLKAIVDQYPDFDPAKKAYAMLVDHSN